MKNHISTLSVLHYVYGGFVCLSGFGLLVLVFLGGFLQSDWLMEQGGEMPPAFVGNLLMIMGWVLFAVVETIGVLNLASAGFIGNRKGSTFSQVVAGINCLSIPFGLALGIFTFVVLNNQEVRQEYGRP
ncbi:MAG TPA: hypothetical protein VGE21_11570 [Flavobacteriales bacterium]